MIQKMKKFLSKRDEGFTLVELIIVIVVLALLIGVSITGYSQYIAKSKLNTDYQNMVTIRSVLVNSAAEEGCYESILTAVGSETDKVVATAVINNTGLTVTGDATDYVTTISENLDSSETTRYKDGTITLAVHSDNNGKVSVTVTQSGYPATSELGKMTTTPAGT